MIRLILAAAMMLGPSFAEKTHTSHPKLATPPALESCDAEDVQSLIGHSLTDQGRIDAQEATGAATVRVVKPGEAVTMDYRADRLTFALDAAGKVLSARCG